MSAAVSKQSSPIRLKGDLLQRAKDVASVYHRTAPNQIEYWAELGMKMERYLSQDQIIAIREGFASVSVETNQSEPVNTSDIFSRLESARRSGGLAKQVTSVSVRYQASVEYPGYLECIDENDLVTVGQFSGGVFISRVS